MSSGPAASEESDRAPHPIEDHPGFWYLVDVDYGEIKDEHSAKESIIGYLLEEFAKRKKSVIEDEYTATTNFYHLVKKANLEEAKQLVLHVYAKYQWENKQKEESFEISEDVGEVLGELAGTGKVVREPINSDWEILWPGDEQIDKEVRGGEVHASKETKADSVVVKKSDSKISIRGHARVRNLVTTNISHIAGVSEVEPEIVDEEVSGQFSNSMKSGNDQFEIIGIEYRKSTLPEKSGIQLDNNRSISRDIEYLEEHGVIPGYSISEISELKIRDIVYGGRYSVSISHHDDGFIFESKTTKKSDKRRDRFEQRFTGITGIAFDTVYEYGSQDSRHLVNRILSGSGEAYDRYFDDLDTDIRDFLDEAISVEPEKYKLCKECGEESDPESELCDNCNESDFTAVNSRTSISVEYDVISSKIYEHVSDIDPKMENDILRFETKTVKLSGNRVVQADVKLFIEPKDNDTTIRRQVYIVPLGNRDRLRRLSDYLLEGIYLKFGDSMDRTYQGYGTIDLFEFLWGKSDREKLLGQAIEDAIFGIKQRVNIESQTAFSNAQKYIDYVNSIDDISQHEDEISEYYSGSNYFEKHVFYLLKRLFPYSERWGKEGQRESDGALILPNPDIGTFDVISYDAKFSTSSDGYDLTSSEQDKAVRYIIDEQTWDRLLAKTGDNGLSAHVLISQNFNQGQFENMAENIKYNVERVEGMGSDFDSEIAFVELESLVGLFSFVHRNWIHFSDPSIRRTLHEELVERITSRSEERLYSHITPETTEEICDNLINRIDSKVEGPILPYSEVGREN